MLSCFTIHPFITIKIQIMTIQSNQLIQNKALELGVSTEVVACSLDIISQNRNLVNAIDNGAEIDDYIYRAVLKQAFEKRQARAEQDVYSDDEKIQRAAQEDLRVLERGELTSDAFYRAVLPLIVKTLHHEPIRRLHAEEASSIVLELADCKRRFRSTSLTEIIVKRCIIEMDSYQAV